MADALITQERDLYESIWAIDAYRSHAPGEEFLPIFLDLIGGAGPMTVLDAGTGSGKGALALDAAGFHVDLCDLTFDGLVPEARHLPRAEACLWSDLRRRLGPRDYVYCCDVLEHIPPGFTMLVVSRLLEVARRGVFLSISLTTDNFGVWVGQPLHKTVLSFPQWRDQLAAIAEIVECRDLLITGLFLLRGRG
jgi:SAM-dependent methyltransferase